MRNTIIKYVLLLTGIISFVLFFPIPGSKDACCIADYANQQWHSVRPALSSMGHGNMARHYVFPYGFLWWAGILLIVISVNGLRRTRKKHHDEQNFPKI